MAGSDRVKLSAGHHQAVNRRRRVIVQYDPNMEIDLDLHVRPVGGAISYKDEAGTVMVGHSELGGQSVFEYEDEPGVQIDSIYWDMGGPATLATWPSKLVEPFRHKALLAWWDKGLDLVKALLDATHQRGLECFWNFRISEADFLPDQHGDIQELPPLKKKNPHWIIRHQHWSGDWNYAVPEVRQFNFELLQELAQNYDFDGFQLDFARIPPFLPVDEAWEHRDALTDFVRRVRLMTLDIERQRGRPFLLAVKIPEKLEGCRADGIDIWTWVEQDLADLLTLGCRSMDVDVAAFRALTAGKNIKLQPCIETHHATAGYKWQPIEFFRGVYGNWWQQGADSAFTFNWSAALQRRNKGEFACRYEATRVELQAYKEIGSPQTLAGKNKFFAVERRGGMPWTGGYANRNHTAPLPATLTNYGRPLTLTVRICDDVARLAEQLRAVTLRVVLLGARQDDQVEVRFNNMPLDPALRDPQWKDCQIHSPGPQPNTCRLWPAEVDPNQRLLRLEYLLPPGVCKLGENQVSIRILDRAPYASGEDLAVEKVEVHVAYQP